MHYETKPLRYRAKLLIIQTKRKNCNRDIDKGDETCRLMTKDYLVIPNKSDFEDSMMRSNKI